MTPEDYQWYINLVKERHHALSLTFEQAEQVYKYEQDKNIISEKHYFSVWEELDYEITIFRQILTVDQLKGYEEYMNENIKRHEQWLIEEDNEKINEIAFTQEMLTYYENVFLPDLFKDHFIFSLPKFHSDKVKIEFLRSEYKVFLNDRKKQILTEHFRHNRLFKPNELQATLLRHKLLYLWPDYSFFKQFSDHSTVAVIDYIKKRVRYPEQTEDLLSKKLAELHAFSDQNIKKYYSDTKGWHVVIGQLAPEDEKEQRIMTLLLLDRDKYDC